MIQIWPRAIEKHVLKFLNDRIWLKKRAVLITDFPLALHCQLGRTMTEQQITSLFVTEMHAEQAIVDPVCHAKMLLLSGNYQSCLDFIQQQASDLLETSPQLIIYHAAALLFCEEGPGISMPY